MKLPSKGMEMRVKKFIRKVSCRALYWAESFYLLAHGWKRKDKNRWLPPSWHRKREYKHSHGHAVNSQKFYHFNHNRKWWHHEPNVLEIDR